MSIKDRLEADLRTSLKAGDKLRTACLRMVKSKLQEREVARRGSAGGDEGLTEEQEIEVVAAYAKQRRDSIAAYGQAGRDDLVEQEEAELAIITEYLPPQVGRDEVRQLVQAVIDETGASSLRDMGAVMKQVMPRLKGAADGKVVNEVVRELLGGG